ncbi:hypothetical protein QD47_09635 [Paenibacillus terrae]|uniref:Uncharacterized protein n=1 Tax=Paenibacillus terrae TaxID=159743 RepID=A0A0D7X396_9BACL|nr:hypothetical protein QD47_09635 [Paenibacillus terrae]
MTTRQTKIIMVWLILKMKLVSKIILVSTKLDLGLNFGDMYMGRNFVLNDLVMNQFLYINR